MEENRNGNTVILTVIGIATLIVALVGATFAYFSANVSNEHAQSISVVTVNPASLIYEGKALVLENAMPGDATSSDDVNSKFYVENPDGNVTQTYDLTLVVDLNGFRLEHIVTDDPNDNVAEGTEQPNQLIASVSAISSDRDNDPTLVVNRIDLTDGETLQAAGQETVLVNDQAIAGGERHTYTVVLNFERLDTNQDENKKKSFSAHVRILDTKTVAN